MMIPFSYKLTQTEPKKRGSGGERVTQLPMGLELEQKNPLFRYRACSFECNAINESVVNRSELVHDLRQWGREFKIKDQLPGF